LPEPEDEPLSLLPVEIVGLIDPGTPAPFDGLYVPISKGLGNIATTSSLGTLAYSNAGSGVGPSMVHCKMTGGEGGKNAGSGVGSPAGMFQPITSFSV
jgi:hypothetical protein